MSDNDKQQLLAIRDKIDAIDSNILSLINQRAKAAQEVAEIKLAADPNAFFYRAEREAQVLRSVKADNPGPLPNESVAVLFREIMSMCLALEQPMKIGFLGPAGTFSQSAAIKFFGHAVTTFGLPSIADVFHEVEAGHCSYGAVPVENSTEGVISHTLDLFLNSNLKICGEVSLRINQHLMAQQEEIKAIKIIYSHQQSLAQCRSWINQNCPHVETIAVASNAEAAKLASQNIESAAIAGETAAEIYQLKQLANNIEDEPGNTTRFLIIGKQKVGVSGQDKTSLLISVKNKSGGLYQMLKPLKDNNISMTKIESRPSKRGMWDYVFFIDIEGHQQDKAVQKTFNELKEQVAFMKILGSYPQAVI